MGTKVSRHPDSRPSTIGVIRLPTALRVLSEFLGFLMVSTGSTLICINGLLLLSRIGLGDSDVGFIEWLDLILVSGIPGIVMVALGIYLTRRLKT